MSDIIDNDGCAHQIQVIFDTSCWSVAKNSTLLKVKAENFPISVVLPLWIGHGNGNKTVKFG